MTPQNSNLTSGVSRHRWPVIGCQLSQLGGRFVSLVIYLLSCMERPFAILHLFT